MLRKWGVLYVLAFVLLLITGCGTGAGDDKTSEVAEIPREAKFGENDYEQVIVAINELGFKLMTEVEADQEGNTFISPMSLFMALSMVYNGADGETKEEIAKALQVEGIDVNELNKANASMMSMLDKETEEIQVDVANSIWLNEDFHFQDEFANHNKNYFNAEIEEIDIATSESAKRINDWVKKATSEKIVEIVDAPLDSNLVTILINAIYFKGDWTYQFDEKGTKNRTFQLESGGKKEVPLMLLNESLAYMENDNFHRFI